MVAVALGASETAVSSFAADGSSPAWALRLLGSARVVGAAAAARQVSALGEMATVAGERTHVHASSACQENPCFYIHGARRKRMVARSGGKSVDFARRVCLYVCLFRALAVYFSDFFFSAGILAGSICMDDTLAALVSGTLAGTVHQTGQKQQ